MSRDIWRPTQAETLNRSTELILMPKIETHGEPQYPFPQAIPQFDPSVYRTNDSYLRLLRTFRTALGNDEELIFNETIHPALIWDADTTIQYMQRVKQASQVERTLSQVTGVTMDTGTLTTTDQTERYFSQRLSHASGDIVTVATSHVVDLALVNWLETKGIKPSEIALVTFDQHFDAGPENGAEPLKSNFQVSLLNQGIAAIAIIGISDDITYELTTGRSQGSDGKSTDFKDMLETAKKIGGGLFTQQTNIAISDYESFQRHRSSLYLPKSYLANGELNKESLSRQLEQMFMTFKLRGIKYILLSADLDASKLFEEQITATSYNPLATILAYGIQDPGKALSRDGFNYQFFQNLVQTFITLKNSHRLSRLDERKMQGIKNYIDKLAIIFMTMGNEVICPIPGIVISNDPTMPAVDPRAGFFISDEVDVIKQMRALTAKAGMQWGVPFGNGTLKAAISEAEGYDLDSRTANAIVKLSNAATS